MWNLYRAIEMCSYALIASCCLLLCLLLCLLPSGMTDTHSEHHVPSQACIWLVLSIGTCQMYSLNVLDINFRIYMCKFRVFFDIEF